MGHTDFDGIIFADTLQDFNALRYAGQTVHILCLDGNMGFTFQGTRYNIAAGDYVILPNAELGSGFSVSDDFRGMLMGLSETFVASIAIRSNYGIIGHLSLLQNPVMKLSARDFKICEAALRYLRMRMEEKEHLFREELVGSLLTAHILDLYDIHARSRTCRHCRSIPPRCCGISSDCYTTANTCGTGNLILRLPPLHHPALPVGNMPESERSSGYLLDRPLHHP